MRDRYGEGIGHVIGFRNGFEAKQFCDHELNLLFFGIAGSGD